MLNHRLLLSLYFVHKKRSPVCVPALIAGLLCYFLWLIPSTLDLCITLLLLRVCLAFVCLWVDFLFIPLSETTVMCSNQESY